MIPADAIVRQALYWYERDCRETRPNGGGCVDEIHVAYNGRVNREAWCAKFAWVVVDGAARQAGVANPLPRDAGARNMLERSRAVLPVDRTPAVGAVGYRKTSASGATGHIVVVVGVTAKGITTVEGNAGNRVALFGYTASEVASRSLGFEFMHPEGGTGASRGLLAATLVLGAGAAAYYTYIKTR